MMLGFGPREPKNPGVVIRDGAHTRYRVRSVAINGSGKYMSRLDLLRAMDDMAGMVIAGQLTKDEMLSTIVKLLG